jgi:hypothetical protein
MSDHSLKFVVLRRLMKYLLHAEALGAFMLLGMVFILAILISFACGYGVRDLVSRRRRAAARATRAAREEYFKGLLQFPISDSRAGDQIP